MKKQLKSLNDFKKLKENASINKRKQTEIFGGKAARTDERTSGPTYDLYGNSYDCIHRIDGEICNVTYN